MLLLTAILRFGKPPTVNGVNCTGLTLFHWSRLQVYRQEGGVIGGYTPLFAASYTVSRSPLWSFHIFKAVVVIVIVVIVVVIVIEPCSTGFPDVSE
jgi:hypothetical protein